MPASEQDGPHGSARRPLVGRATGALLALAGGVVVALLIGWAVLGWTTQLLLPVGAVAAAWAVGEAVRVLLERDGPRR